MIAPDLLPLVRPIDSLHEDPKNARKHDARNVEAIKGSLLEFGQRKPIVALADGTVIAGNGTLVAARALGWTEVAVATFEDEGKARAFAIADNRTSDLSVFDDALLVESLSGMDEELRKACGFTDDEFLRLRGGIPGLTDPDDAPDTPAVPTSRPGDVWALGRHRLLCGDSRDAGAVAQMAAGEHAVAMWTDPPYGVNYQGGTKEALTIENDVAVGLPELLRDAFAVANQVLEEGAAVHVAHPAGALSVVFGQAFLDAGWCLHQTLVWVKDCMVLGHSDYHYRHEPLLFGYRHRHESVLYGRRRGGGRRGRGNAGWFGSHSETTVFEVPRPRRSEQHPTMKPVALVDAMLRNTTKVGDLVYEPFAGSGTTVIACERLRRRCLAVELDPRYADVVVARWEAFTGGKAERVRG